MMYQITAEDIQLANAQLDHLNGDRTVWDVFVDVESKKYRVLNLEMQGEEVKVWLVNAEFDFGDGYYTSYAPGEDDGYDELFELLDPKVREIVETINTEWEDEHLSSLEYFELPDLYLNTMKRREHIAASVAVLRESAIRHRSYQGDAYDLSSWESEADLCEQLIAVLEGTRTLDSVEQKKTLRDLERERDRPIEEEVFLAVHQYYAEHPLSDDQLKRISVLSASERKLGYTFRYTRFEWKTPQPDWSLDEHRWMNAHLIFEQEIIPPEGRGAPYTIEHDPRNIVIRREINRQLEERGVKTYELIESDKEDF